MSDKIVDQVKHIINTLENGFGDELNSDGFPMDAMDYLQDVLDIEYIINSKREYLGARVLVAFGGPNVWIDTRKGVVEGHWWGDNCTLAYRDGIGLDEALSELYACTC